MSEQFIQANQSNLSDLLSGGQTAYVIPPYQRPYSWNKEQWDELLSDLEGLEDGDRHFVGAIVFVPQEPDKVRLGLNRFEVVDGQQRIVTLSILLAAIRDTVTNERLANDITAKYLTVTPLGEEAQQKVELGPSDNEQYEQLLSNPDRMDRRRLFAKCYNHFLEHLDGSEQYATELLNTVLYSVYVVQINALNMLNAFKLFETMNDRGLELSAADLIKNHLFMRVSNSPKVLDEVQREWLEMYELVQEFEPVKFIRRFMLSRYKGKLSERKLYEGVKTRTDSLGPTEILDFARQLNAEADTYQKIRTATTGDKEIDARLRDLEMVQVAPSHSLLLRLVGRYLSNQFPKDKLIRILELIESFHIRLGIVGLSTSELDTLYNQICVNVSEMERPQEIYNYVESSLRDRASYISDEAFVDSLVSRDLNPTEQRTKYILWRLDKNGDATTIQREHTNTEHVMPVTLSQEWIEYLADQHSSQGLTNGDVELKHDELCNRLGNLVLLEEKWNKSIRNGLFEAKKKGKTGTMGLVV